MRQSFFGTDGIRGAFGPDPISSRFFLRLGRALGLWLVSRGLPLRVLVGRDSRLSGGPLFAALADGLLEQAVDVYDGGVLATPLIPMGLQRGTFGAGVMITASHNPFCDNGFKFFGPDGKKASVELEKELETFLDLENLKTEAGRGRLIPYGGELLIDYERFWKTVFREPFLADRLILLDLANGAAAAYGGRIFSFLGGRVEVLNCHPNGKNINADCGSEWPDGLRRQVLARGAFAGLALDGDGDRVVVCDGKGFLVPGENLLASLTLAAGAQALVTTVQSNGALDEFLGRKGVAVRRTAVGDRNVLEALNETEGGIGGEPSGHLLHPSGFSTADGLLTGAQFLSRFVGSSVSVLDFRMTPDFFPLFPARSVAIPVAEKVPLENYPHFLAAMETVRQRLVSGGRLLVRYSGTENRLRILIEGRREDVVAEALDFLLAAWGR